MSNLIQLRKAAREVFEETLRDIDAGSAVKREVSRQGSRLIIRDVSLDLTERKVYSIAIGKAASPMAQVLENCLGASFTAGIVSGPAQRQTVTISDRWQVFEGGHPQPNEDSLLAGNAAIALLERANQENALVIFLISGGGSAMLESPASPDSALSALRRANTVLVGSGASIGEINAVRRAFSAIKGGRLAARAANCDQITLIISDVPAGQEWNVASGPTTSPPPDSPKAREVVEKYQLRSQLRDSILRAIDSDPIAPSDDSSKLRVHFVLLSNDDALEAAASAALRRGYRTEFARTITDERIESGCEKLLLRLVDLRSSAARTIGADVCLISSGEFSCPVKGDGLGGRNLETALRLAIKANEDGVTDFAALCAGTDGIDGNSPAAGALVDSTTIERAHKIGLDPKDFLYRSDAYSFFVALGDVITTGPTGTNVRDLRILLQSSARKTN